MKIALANYKHLTPEEKEDLKLQENRKFPWIVYCGRAMPRYGLKASPLANPFKPRNEKEISEVLYCYERMIKQVIASPDSNLHTFENTNIIVESKNIYNELTRLKSLLKEHGKLTLVCWCVDKDGNGICHTKIIKDVLEAK